MHNFPLCTSHLRINLFLTDAPFTLTSAKKSAHSRFPPKIRPGIKTHSPITRFLEGKCETARARSPRTRIFGCGTEKPWPVPSLCLSVSLSPSAEVRTRQLPHKAVECMNGDLASTGNISVHVSLGYVLEFSVRDDWVRRHLAPSCAITGIVLACTTTVSCARQGKFSTKFFLSLPLS